MSAWGQRGWEKANARGRDKVRQDIPDTQRPEGQPQGPPPPWPPASVKMSSSPLMLSVDKETQEPLLLFKVLLIEHEKAISL